MASKSAQETGSSGGHAEREAVPEALVGLWARARPKMMGRLETLKRAVRGLENNRLSDEERASAVREAHKLAGSLGTYGLMSGSKLAREIELRLEEQGEAEREGAGNGAGNGQGDSDRARWTPPEPEWLRSRVRAMEVLLRQNDAGPDPPVGLGNGENGSVATQGMASGTHDDPIDAPGAHSVPAPKPPPPLNARRDPTIRWDEAAPGDSDVATEGPAPEVVSLGDQYGDQVVRPTGRPALARLLRRSLQELQDVEAEVASSIRQVGGHVAAPVSGDRLRGAAFQLDRVAGWLQEVGIDLPARRTKEISRRLEGRLDPVEVGHVAQELLTVQRLLGRLDHGREDRGGVSCVLVVSRDRVWAQKTRTALEVLGHHVELSAPGRSMDSVRGSRFSGVVVDGGTGDLDGLRSLSGRSSVPVVYAVESPHTRGRVEAGRLGAGRVVDRAVPARELCGVLSDLIRVSSGVTSRVLLMDDDETVLQAVDATLRHAGFEVTTVQGPEGFWQALEGSSPDLVITDLDMPGMDGAQLTLAMRTDARWVNLPVVFLSSKDDAASLRRVFEAGADDFLPKPLRPEVLLSRVRARLARLRTRSATGHLDPVTRLPVGAAFEHVMEDLVQAADSSRRPLTIAVLRLDASARLRDQLGQVGLERAEARLARVLSGHVEPPAVVGRRETDRFVLVFPGMDVQDASALAGRIVELFASADRSGGAQVTVSAGIAQCGMHGRRPVELVSAAESARARAEEAGGSKVFLAGGESAVGRVRKVDVLVVDDDPAIGELLLETLAQKGWSVVWEQESEQAVRRLVGPQQDLRARVVLLDVNMPGMDGLTVLRLLRENRVVPGSHVIMLTVRAREDEVVRALNMGASDHVAKPFSVPVLMTRIQRALEASR